MTALSIDFGEIRRDGFGELGASYDVTESLRPE
jgi:hypothetical protein